MTKVNANTKLGQSLIARANCNKGETLNQIYGKCSAAKKSAYDDCCRICAAEDGWNFHITSYNAMMFCIAFETKNGTRLITPTKSYLIA